MRSGLHTEIESFALTSSVHSKLHCSLIGVWNLLVPRYNKNYMYSWIKKLCFVHSKVLNTDYILYVLYLASKDGYHDGNLDEQSENKIERKYESTFGSSYGFILFLIFRIFLNQSINSESGLHSF